MSTHGPTPNKLYYPDVPYEDHKQTKEIVRMEMHRIALGIQQGTPLVAMNQLLRETRKILDKLGNPELSHAFQDLSRLLHNGWPLNEQTPWDTIQTVGRILAFIDEKTMY